MDRQSSLITLKHWSFIAATFFFVLEGMALFTELTLAILTTQGKIDLPSQLWTGLRVMVLAGTIVVCLFGVVRLLSRRSFLISHWHALWTGLVSMGISFLLSPDLFWNIVSFCSATISFIALLSAEYSLLKRRQWGRNSQQKRVQTPYAARTKPKNMQRKQPVQEQITLAQQKIAPRLVKQLGSSDPASSMQPLSSLVLPKTLIFYCTKDRRWKEKCFDHFQPFERQGMLELWDESRILPGSVRQQEIEQALASAEAVVLLVSDCFLGSRFTQLDSILHYQQNRNPFQIYPVIVSPCSYEYSPLRHLQPYWSSTANPAQKSLEELPCVKQKESLRDLAQTIAQRLAPPTYMRG